jgi:hypothetical protein
MLRRADVGADIDPARLGVEGGPMVPEAVLLCPDEMGLTGEVKEGLQGLGQVRRRRGVLTTNTARFCAFVR